MADFAFYSTEIDPTVDPAEADPAPDTLVVLDQVPILGDGQYNMQGGEIGRAMLKLREFMFDRVYLGPSAEPERERALATVRRIFDHLIVHPEELPPDGVGDPVQCVTDYVAGMTDRFALAWR